MIGVQSVSKVYRLYRRPSDRIREILPFSKRPRHVDFWALRDISFQVEKGETLGLIGPNGSGKSTLLQVVSGILQPSSGRVSTEGRIAALLELGAGFNPDFTGRENVFLNSEIMGLSRSEIERVFPAVADFAGIGDFMDRPVKEYSSGMYVRLAFSTAIHVDPDILIVDEALAVGDAIFSNRCVKKFQELRERNVTILFVSHDLGLVKQLADRAIFMMKGEIRAQGAPADVVNRYIGTVLGDGDADPEEATPALPSSYRHGNRASRVVDVELLDAAGRPAETVQAGETVTVRIKASFEDSVQSPVVGILIRNRLGLDVFGTNTQVEGEDLGLVKAGESVEVSFTFGCLLTRQDYTLTVATQNWDGTSQDWLDDVLRFTVVDTKATAGVANLGTKITWTTT